MNIKNNHYTKEQLHPLFVKAEKPARYVGGEVNSVTKEECDVSIALSYPDLYEIGMANNGLQILYASLREEKSICCERFFAPAHDFAALLKENGLALYSLESYRPLSEFDILGFNCSHELLYTNVLYMLDCANIPLLAAERDDSMPIIIAGGEAISNPAPMSMFVDLFFFGEGDQSIKEIAFACSKGRKEGLTKAEILVRLQDVEGVLVPAERESVVNSEGFTRFDGPKVTKHGIGKECIVTPLKPLIPNMRISQDKAVVEITRGCDNLCKFCHAGYYTLPYRNQPYVETAKKALELLDATGYDTVTFSSLSISDYKYLVPLINEVLPEFNRRGISMSLPSLKVDSNTLPIIETISKVKKVSLTFAVESANTEIRKIIHKRLSIEDLLEIVTYIFERGWKTLKLYFMLGLPGYNTYDEGQSIVDLLHTINRIGKGKVQINATLSPFIPKPHTPFQDVEMAPLEYFDDVIGFVRSHVPRKVVIKNHNIYSSRTEGFLARGDIETGKAILRAYQEGAYFDSWDEFFKKNIWMEIIDEYQRERNYYAPRVDAEFPWSVVLTGSEELIKVKKARILEESELSKMRMTQTEELATEKIESAMDEFERKYEKKAALRFVFTKEGKAVYISHLDMAEVVKRALRIAKIPICFSQGFNKRERLSFGFPLPLGIASKAEMVSCDLYDLPVDGYEERINLALPEGMRLAKSFVTDKKETIMAETQVILYHVSASSDVLKSIENGLAQKPSMEKRTKKGTRTVCAADSIYNVSFTEDLAEFYLHTGTSDSLRIDQLIPLLCEDEESSYSICKMDQYSLSGNQILSLQ